MKSTIKLNGKTSLRVEPASAGNAAWGDVFIQFKNAAGESSAWMTGHECAALIFGLEMALEVSETRRVAVAA